MNHSFQPSLTNILVCNKCKRNELDHTDRATCDCCSNSGRMEIYIDMLMCSQCLENEHKLQKENTTPEKQNERVEAINKPSLDLIKVREDIFNSEIESIEDLKLHIDSNPQIENKRFELARLVDERIKHLSKVIFDLDKTRIDESNKQRAAQIYLNELNNKLTMQERERLHLSDMSYEPTKPKLNKAGKVAPKPKFDKTELARFARICGLPEAALQMVCIARKCTPEQACSFMQSNKS